MFYILFIQYNYIMKDQFITVPNEVAADRELELLDTLIYATIKKFMNTVTLTCYPSIDTIRKLSGLSKDRIRKGIDNLAKLGYIEVTLIGRKNVYKFNHSKQFEIFSFDFLELPNLTPTEKALQLRMQRLEHLQGTQNICTLSDAECAREINVPRSTFDRTIKSMAAKGYVDIIPTKNYAGLTVNGKYFKLDELQQAIVYKIKNHEERVSNVEEKVSTLEEQLADALKELEYLKRKDRMRDIEEANVIEERKIKL